MKTFEQTDYSTPEKACFSTASARTYEWSKSSYYGEYLKESYSPLKKWKTWHSGSDCFAEIIYKVEISDEMSKVPGKPQLFLVKKLLYDKNKIVAVPMTFENGNWKFIIRWTVHIDILSD